ncbi:hypothetical protein FPV67DRAFT_1445819 [Lyophyllum atratum]|nr:hypothetical protein FPV67DRAFT_1445819 [Lyophyllum atratum]
MAVGRMWWPSCAGAVVVWLGVWDGAAGVRCRAVVRDVVGGLLGWLWLLAVTVVGGVVLVTWGWASVVLGVRACPHFGRARVTWRCWWCGAVTEDLRGVLGVVGRVLAVGAEGTQWGGGGNGGGGG